MAHARPEPALRERGGVGVVVDHDRHLDPAHQRVAQRLVAPGQVRREQHGRRGRRRRTRPRRCRPRPRRAPRQSSSTSSTIVSSTARTLRPGVSRRRTVSTVPNESTTPPSTFVPPMSMPIVNGPGRPIIARRGAGRSGSGMSRRLRRGSPTVAPCTRSDGPRSSSSPSLATVLVASPGQASDGVAEGAAPAERARLQRRTGRRRRRHLDADRGDPLPGRQPAGTDRLAERPHPDHGCTPTAPVRCDRPAGARRLAGPPHRDQPEAELRVAGARRRQRGGPGRDRRQPALPAAGHLLARARSAGGPRRSATTATPAAACGCTTSRGSRRAGSASTRSRSTAPRAPRSTRTSCSAPTTRSRTAASGSAGGCPTGSGTSRRPAPRSSSCADLTPLVEVRRSASGAASTNESATSTNADQLGT